MSGGGRNDAQLLGSGDARAGALCPSVSRELEEC